MTFFLKLREVKLPPSLMQTNFKMQIFKSCKGVIKAQASSMSFPSNFNSSPMYRNALFTASGYYLEGLKELPKPLIPGNWKS